MYTTVFNQWRRVILLCSFIKAVSEYLNFRDGYHVDIYNRIFPCFCCIFERNLSLWAQSLQIIKIHKIQTDNRLKLETTKKRKSFVLQYFHLCVEYTWANIEIFILRYRPLSIFKMDYLYKRVLYHYFLQILH